MARFKDHNRALVLRKQGMSYSQIKEALGVSKSTLSCWLKEYPLSKTRIRELRDRNAERIERFRTTMKQKRDARLSCFYKRQQEKIFPIKNRELYLCGLFLYWGEGSKSHQATLTISNTDPSMIKFFIKWLTVCLNIKKVKLKIHLHLYSDMNIESEIGFWSRTINIPVGQFIKPYIKKTKLKDVDHKNGFGHGTCCVNMGDARLTEETLMGIEAIRNKYIKL